MQILSFALINAPFQGSQCKYTQYYTCQSHLLLSSNLGFHKIRRYLRPPGKNHSSQSAIEFMQPSGWQKIRIFWIKFWQRASRGLHNKTKNNANGIPVEALEGVTTLKISSFRNRKITPISCIESGADFI